MYYFYSPQMFAPYQWGLERDVSYAYMPYNSFYYGDYTNSLSYAYIPQNYEVQMKVDERGSWTPFSWVEKYAYAFSDRTIKRKSHLHLMIMDLEFTSKILDKLKQHNVKATFSYLVKTQKSFRMS